MVTDASPASVPIASALADVLFGKARRSILSLLFTRPTESFHLRQLVRLARIGVGPAQRELASLTAAGIVTRVPRGVHVYFSANPRCPVYSELMGIITKTAGVADVLRAALTPFEDRIFTAYVFGSFARGEQHAESDLDLLVLSDSLSMAELVPALTPVQRSLGREINPIIYTPAEYRKKMAAGHTFLRRVSAAPRILLLGEQLEP